MANVIEIAKTLVAACNEMGLEQGEGNVGCRRRVRRKGNPSSSPRRQRESRCPAYILDRNCDGVVPTNLRNTRAKWLAF
jgi:hypothetical protein